MQKNSAAKAVMEIRHREKCTLKEAWAKYKAPESTKSKNKPS